MNLGCTRIVYNNRFVIEYRYFYTFSSVYVGNKPKSYFFLLTFTSLRVVFRLLRRSSMYADYAHLFGDSITQITTFEYIHVKHNAHYS